MIRQGPTRLAEGPISLREVRPEDVQALFDWRRVPRVRELFHSEGPESWQAHLRFCERYFAADNDDAWFVIEVNGDAVGALALYRATPGGPDWEAGRIVLAPQERGLRAFRVARVAIALLMEYACACGHRTMRCEVLAQNRVMQAIVSSLGFEVRHTGERGGRRYLEMIAGLAETSSARPARAFLARSVEASGERGRRGER